MYLIVWRFQVIPERRSEFLRCYATAGEWSKLFAKAPGWRGTELVALDGTTDIFLTIDRWDSIEAWDRFRADFAAEYEALDRICEGLTLKEEKVGAGVSL
ncbi:MAG TPA: antibiotic biosynthesis monooxygenase [Gemmatimonadales bacterium]